MSVTSALWRWRQKGHELNLIPGCIENWRMSCLKKQTGSGATGLWLTALAALGGPEFSCQHLGQTTPNCL